MRALLVLLALTAVARADETPSPSPSPPFAIAVNAPFRWAGGDALALSGYIGLTDRQALRLNVASYANAALLADVVTILGDGDGDEAFRTGRTTDVGVGWMLFPDRLWNGFNVELGALVRVRNTREEDDFASPQVIEHHTTTLAARALIGWSFTIGQHAFISIAAGVSAGHAWGHETADSLDHPMPMTTSVSRSEVAAEGFLRLGWAFGQ